MKKTICIFIGTRPDAIKMAPLIKEFEKNKDFKLKVIASGQHKKLLKQVLEIFNINTDVNFDIMKEGQKLSDITRELTKHLEEYLRKNKISLFLVQGDTTTSMVGALVSYYNKIPIAHIEAGLRTFDKFNPFPEEMNRKIIDDLADLLFAPTELNKNNLIREGIKEEKIFVTGNTVIDALNIISKNLNPDISLVNLIKKLKGKILTLTCHRRENFGENLKNIIKGIKKISKSKEFSIVIPVHPNPNVRKPFSSELKCLDNVYLINPLDYQSMIYLLKKSYAVLTDSGGLVEECAYLNIPVLILREKTERVESVEYGIAKIVGTDPNRIYCETINLLDENCYKNMRKNISPYGDGKASIKIKKHIINFLDSLLQI